MPAPRLTRVVMNVVLTCLLLASGSFVHQRPLQGKDGTGLDKITWSGRIRIEWQLHQKPGPPSQMPGENVAGSASRDAVTITEYQVEALPHDARQSWSSPEVRVQVRGHNLWHSKWTWTSPGHSKVTTSAEQSQGSGNTIAGVSVFLREPGDQDQGHCRLELGPIGERDDHGPLTQFIEFKGSSQGNSVARSPWGTSTSNWNNPVSLKVQPDSALVDIPCAKEAKSLHGDKVLLDSGGQFRRISYDLSQDGEAKTEVELIPAEQYDQWLPQAGETEKAIGDFIDVRIVAHTKGDAGSKPPQKILKYKIELEGTSKERGVDLNWPRESTGTPEYDMKIDKDNPWIKVKDDNAQSAETKEEDLTEFMVTVNSHDWGGWTKLKVTAELEDHSTVVAHVKGHPDQETLALPKDDNSNHIADYWEHWFEIKNADENADDDKIPLGDSDEGDSIALYDEYRGFHIQGQHERLSPEIKDLFVWDQHKLGVGLYGSVTGVSLHPIRDSERELRGEQDIVSANGRHQTVYAIWVHNGSIDNGVVGETEGGPGVPAKIKGITIDSALIAAAYGKYAASERQSTVAHELGHATNVWHHGDGPDYLVGDVMCRRPDGTVINWMCSAKATPGGPPPKAAENCYEVAAKGGMYSGNDTCMMRYDMTHFYENPKGNCQWKRGTKTVLGKKYGQDPPGMSMCESARGTGVNDASNPDNKAGDASSGRGECKHKFCLNNKKH